MSGRIRVGISGWRYRPWRGVFYPRGLRQADELGFAAARFDSVEINGSFYSLQTPRLYSAWRDATPVDFVFAVKGSRFITHMKKLRDVDVPLANFFASGLLCLEDKLGPLLWQFPPNLAFDGRFEEFFAKLPRDTLAASALAARHDARVRSPATGSCGSRPLRHAVEVRHPSFCAPQFLKLLKRENIALVAADSAGLYPYFEEVTAEFSYVRLHGATELYVSGYSDPVLLRWARKVRAWSDGAVPVASLDSKSRARRARDVYVYFDNDAKVHAPFDAQKLALLLRGSAAPSSLRRTASVPAGSARGRATPR